MNNIVWKRVAVSVIFIWLNPAHSSGSVFLAPPAIENLTIYDPEFLEIIHTKELDSCRTNLLVFWEKVKKCINEPEYEYELMFQIRNSFIIYSKERLANAAEYIELYDAAIDAISEAELDPDEKIEYIRSFLFHHWSEAAEVIGPKNLKTLIEKLGGNIKYAHILLTDQEKQTKKHINGILKVLFPDEGRRKSIKADMLEYYNVSMSLADEPLDENSERLVNNTAIYIIGIAAKISERGVDVHEKADFISGFRNQYPSLYTYNILLNPRRVLRRLAELPPAKREYYLKTYRVVEEIISEEGVDPTLLPALYPFVYQLVKNGGVLENEIMMQAKTFIERLEREKLPREYITTVGMEIEIHRDAFPDSLDDAQRRALLKKLEDLEFLGVDFDPYPVVTWDVPDYSSMPDYALAIELRTLPSYLPSVQEFIIDFINSEYPEALELEFLSIHLNTALGFEVNKGNYETIGHDDYSLRDDVLDKGLIRLVREYSSFPSLFLYCEDPRWKAARYDTPADIKYSTAKIQNSPADISRIRGKPTSRLECRCVGLKFGDKEGWEEVVRLHQLVSSMIIAHKSNKLRGQEVLNTEAVACLLEVWEFYSKGLEELKQQYGIEDKNNTGYYAISMRDWGEINWLRFYEYKKVVEGKNEWIGLENRRNSEFGVKLRKLIQDTFAMYEDKLSNRLKVSLPGFSDAGPIPASQ